MNRRSTRLVALGLSAGLAAVALAGCAPSSGDGGDAGVRRDHGRGATDAIRGVRGALLDETELDELPGERGDRRSVEAGGGRQSRPGERPFEVHQPEEFREVSTVHPVERSDTL